jgi:hypothetical protein
MAFGCKFLQIAPSLIATAGSRPVFTDEIKKAVNVKKLFFDMEWGDLYEDARMRDVIIYLYGNKHLKIPTEWREFLPAHIPDQ